MVKAGRAALVAGAILGGILAAPAAAPALGGPVAVTNGFATPSGDGFWITSSNGHVDAVGNAPFKGDASRTNLHGWVLGGAADPRGGGYWLVSTDGGIFSYGRARFFGSMGAHKLNQPVFAMTPTRSGNGYWLVARDGGIFAFGDAPFYGSAGAFRLNAPIVGITTSPSGRGYRMIGSDGGIFSFGDVPYFGSLPGLGLRVNDVVGMAPTPSNRGYWIVRRNGQAYSFGDAPAFGQYTTSSCVAPVVGAFANPAAPGYRMVTRAGLTVPAGNAPGGVRVTGGSAPWCGVTQDACRPRLASAYDYQAVLNTRGPSWTGGDGALPIELGNGQRLWLFGDTFSGPVDGREIKRGDPLVRNTVALESGGCFEFRLGGLGPFVTDYMPHPGSDWYWPTTGVVNRAAGVVLIGAMRMGVAPGPPGWNWRIVRNEIVVLDLHSLAPLSTIAMPHGGAITWGLTMAQDGNTIYVYGRGANVTHYVARTTVDHLVDGQWQFFDGSGWSNNESAAQPMQFQTVYGTPDTAPSPTPVVQNTGSGFLLSSKRCDVLCDDLTAWYAPTAAGPWRAVNENDGRVATTVPGAGQFAYSGHLVQSRGGWLAGWSVNNDGSTTNKYAYGPRLTTPVDLPAPDELAAQYASPPQSPDGGG